uniref:Aminopeptidase n=1 Tax=Trichoplusia ni TaxID=7111 RepID=G0ZL62_TRINI|nr:aminopeptidase N6 [Trichoplusia ni]
MSQTLLWALGLALLAVAKADNPISYYIESQDFPFDEIPEDTISRNDQRVYRLPTSVVPVEYDIHINLFFAERTEKPFSYEGFETIIVEAKEEVNEIVLHANVDRIQSISVFDSTGRPLRLQRFNPFHTEKVYHFLKINLAETLAVGAKYTLHINYEGTMNVGPMKRGIWRGWYVDSNNVERIYATTHFQPYNARQAFPCWDEPYFKAIFKLRLSSPSGYTGTFSNTAIEQTVPLPNNRVRVDFAPTPKMSSYLVTFLVSESFQVIAQDTSFDPPIRIIGRSNTNGLADHALDLAVKMTKHFDSYFEIPYSSLSPNLLNDHISSPDWASAGTENWGMVSYRELYLILSEEETLMSVEHYAATLVSHELAHKWFGNLITCHWWSNTWINEGYASYFGYIATHEMFPKYEFPDHFNTRYLQTSLSFDSGISTVPLNHDVNTPAQVTGHFGTISYSKAAAFLRMTANIMSPETFRKSCKLFLQSNAYSPTDPDDLLKSMLEAIEEDNSLADYGSFSFADYYNIWVNEPGYPILNVTVNHTTGVISLSQERFFLSSSAAPTGQIYPIPITFSTKTNPSFSILKPSHIMTGATLTINKAAVEEWVIFNNMQHGHYRVNYDSKTWSLIAEALLEEPSPIHILNRAQIVDDVFALMRSNRMTHNEGFKILKFLAKETSIHIWSPAISGFTWLRNRLRHLPAKQAEFDAFLLSQMEHAINELGYEPKPNETPTITMARQDILQFACTLGHEKCNQDSWERFVNLRDNGVPINARIRRNVYMTAMRKGNQRDFEYLLNRFRSSNYANDQLEMLRGMGASTDPELLTRYLALTLQKAVRTHDKLNSFNYALLGNNENVKTVVMFVKHNIDQIRTAYVEDSPANPVHSALSNIAAYLDEDGLDDYEQWLRTTQYGIPQFNSAISGINSARNNIAWGTANADVILAAARGSAAAAVASITLLICMALLSTFV